MLFTHVFSLSCVVYPPCPSLWQNEVGERYVFFAAMNDTTPTSEAQDNSSLLDLLDDAVASQLTTSALVTKIRELIEENTRLKAELRRYREREEIAHAELEDAAPGEPPREPPREPPMEPPMEPPLTPRTSTACGVTPQEWMGMYPYRHQTRVNESAASRVAAAQEVPVHMWRTPRTTLPRHPLCHHPARSLTPDTVVRPACGVAAGTPEAAMRRVATPHRGGLEGTKLVGPLRGPRGSRQGREREPPLELTEGQGAGAGSEPLSSPYECPLFSASFRQPPDSPDSGSLLSKQGKELELTAVAGADCRGTQPAQSARALLEAKADLEELTAKALRELRVQHGDELSAQWWVQQAAGGSDYYCALLEAGAHKDPSRPSR